MTTRRRLFALSVAFVPFTFCAADAEAQGLIRRLRNRIAPIIQGLPVEEAPANSLPARPLSPALRPTSPLGEQGDGATANRPAAPAAGYRVPSANDPAANGPTPATGPTGIRRAGDPEPTGQAGNPSTRSSGPFGRSVLKPLSSENDASFGEISSAAPRASLGIKAVTANPGYPAVQITEILVPSAAGRAGLRAGDYLFAIDGVPTPTVAKLKEQVAVRRPGETVRMRFGRSGRVSELDVALAVKPGVASVDSRIFNRIPQPSTAQSLPDLQGFQQRIGAQVADVAGRRGVSVTKVQSASPADAAGLKVDDRIVAIDGRMVSDSQSLLQRIAAIPANAALEIRLIRDDQLLDVTLDDAATGPTRSNAQGGLLDPASTPAAAGSNNPGSNNPGSLIGGLGSVLGGLFNQPPPTAGTKEGAAVTPPTGTLPTGEVTRSNDEPAELLPPASPARKDPLALEDSIDALPPNDVSTANSKDREPSETLKEEIQRLRDQLKNLEAQLEK